MSNRATTAATGLSLILVLAIGWFAVISPQRSDASSADAQIQATQAQIATLKAQTASGTATRKSVALARRELRKLGKALPRSYAEPGLINTLQAEARRTGIDFQSISFTAPTAAGAMTAAAPAATTTTSGATPLGFTLTVAGGYFKVSRFVAHLQNLTGATANRIWVNGRLLAFTSLSLAASKTAAGSVSATLSGNAYLITKAGNAGAGAATTTAPATGSDATAGS